MDWFRIRFAVPALMFMIGGILLCAFAPWQQVHPSDASLVQSLGRAALWTHAYDAVPGARLDSFELMLETTVLLAISVLVGFSNNAARNPSA